MRLKIYEEMRLPVSIQEGPISPSDGLENTIASTTTELHRRRGSHEFLP